MLLKFLFEARRHRRWHEGTADVRKSIRAAGPAIPKANFRERLFLAFMHI
jgi:hypothetical protein